jgi:hypothetical protein
VAYGKSYGGGWKCPEGMIRVDKKCQKKSFLMKFFPLLTGKWENIWAVGNAMRASDKD